MRSKIVLLVCTFFCFVGFAKAQNGCATDEVYQRLKKEHPEIEVYEQQLEQQIKAGIHSGAYNKFAKTTNTDTVVYDIPLVVHVIHDFGSEYLSDNAIIDAVNYWATVYVEHNPDTVNVITPFKSYIGNPLIRLHLATIDPNGKPTHGIVRTHSYLTYNADDQSKLDGWPNTEYVNIWFINYFGNADAGAAAYAYYPSSGAALPFYDGVIGLYSYLNYDKAIPHEIGHVLNLEHPWGNTNQPGVACGDDEVDDTPPTMGHDPVSNPALDCNPATAPASSPLWDTTCASHYQKTYTSSNGSDSIAHYPDTVNAQNIMDYTYCQVMFTKGQVYRMRQALTSTVASRNNLYSAANLQATGALAPFPDLPPVAAFSVEKGNGGNITERSYFLCAGDNVTRFTFGNRSWNDTVSSVQWTLSNDASNPTSASMGFVQSSFSQPGWVTVQLIANSNAGSDTITNTHAVYVADTAVQQLGYSETFANPADTNSWPMFNYYDNQFKWGWYNGAGYDDNTCVRYRSYDDRTYPANAVGTPVGDHDDMITPGIDLAGITGDLNLNFYTSGAVKSGNSNGNDTLEISASINCGATWQPIANLTGSQIINNGAQSSEFIPTNASQWKAQTISLGQTFRTSKTFFRFRYLPGSHGNNMYFDKFSVSQYPTEVNEVVNSDESFKVYPNPTTAGSNIAFKAGTDGKVTINIKDIAGRVVYQKAAVYQPGQLVQEPIQRSTLPAAGIYFITLDMNNSTATQKLVIY